MCGNIIVYSQYFDDDEWDVLVKCHVEENGEWCESTIYTLRSSSEPGSDVCLYFGGEEYEGLPPNTYSLIKDDHLYDSENDEVPIRNLIIIKMFAS